MIGVLGEWLEDLLIVAGAWTLTLGVPLAIGTWLDRRRRKHDAEVERQYAEWAAKDEVPR